MAFTVLRAAVRTERGPHIAATEGSVLEDRSTAARTVGERKSFDAVLIVRADADCERLPRCELGLDGLRVVVAVGVSQADERLECDLTGAAQLDGLFK